MPTFRDGQVNVSGITNPGVYVDIIPPTPLVTGVPTNFEGMVGVASWGPVNSVRSFSTFDDCVGIYGNAADRPGDIAKAVAAATQIGSAINFKAVRVTDGTDTAASATIPSSAGTVTARYTGSRGNAIGVVFQKGSAINSFAAIVNFPGRTPERFDNLLKGLASLTVTPGTGYTSVPSLSLTAPQLAGGAQATAKASLKVVSQTVGSGGTGYVVGDTITLPNGVVLTVATVSTGAVSTVTLTNAGAITSGPTPANPVGQVSTSGSGTGATFNLVWGLGPATIAAGSGYTSAPTITMSGGGAGTGGSYATPVVSVWPVLANAINNGTSTRGRSSYVVFTAGSGTGDPVIGTIYTLTGGTDGASGVGTTQIVGVDSAPRTGMYALRGSGCDAFTLIDNTDSSIWGVMLALGISEGMYPVSAMASGGTIADAIAARASAGMDDSWFKLLAGDWPTMYIPGIGSTLTCPSTVAVGLYGNLSPEQGTINKPLTGVLATQTSQAGILTSDADNATAQTGGIDIIGKSSALGADYFTLLTGRNTSSNSAANGDEYTRLTNFLARSIQGAATRSIVGKLQSLNRADDPTRLQAKAVLDSFFQSLQSPSVGSGGYGMIDAFAVTCDLTNNTPSTIARGFLFAFCAVRYLNTVRYFVIKLQGGGNVTVTSQDNQPSLGQVVQLAA